MYVIVLKEIKINYTIDGDKKIAVVPSILYQHNTRNFSHCPWCLRPDLILSGILAFLTWSLTALCIPPRLPVPTSTLYTPTFCVWAHPSSPPSVSDQLCWNASILILSKMILEWWSSFLWPLFPPELYPMVFYQAGSWRGWHLLPWVQDNEPIVLAVLRTSVKFQHFTVMAAKITPELHLSTNPSLLVTTQPITALLLIDSTVT